MNKFYIIANSRKMISTISSKLQSMGKFQFFGVSRDNQEVRRNVDSIVRSDILLIEYSATEIDIPECFKDIAIHSASTSYSKKPLRILMSDDSKTTPRAYYAAEQGFDLIINVNNSKDYIRDQITKTILYKAQQPLGTQLKTFVKEGVDIDGYYEKLTSILHDIGIPASLAGYQYLKQAITMAFIDIDTVVGGVTKVIYPSVALIYNTTITRVERSIRHAIEVGWGRANVDAMEEIFSYSYSEEKGKPTNGEFIANIAEYLLIRFRKQRAEFLFTHQDSLMSFMDAVDISKTILESNDDEMDLKEKMTIYEQAEKAFEKFRETKEEEKPSEEELAEEDKLLLVK